MKVRYLFYFTLFTLLISLNGCTSDDTIIPANLAEKSLLNVSYGSSSEQVFDLYLPANRTANTKTLILVHGGGWIEGDKQDMSYLVPIFKQNLPNYAIANINYRLAVNGNFAFPMQINDIKSVINKLKTENYVISNQFGFVGTSAGGHLSLLYSYAHDTNSEIKMVASIVGPTNFTDSNYTNNPAWIANYLALTGVNYQGNEAYFESLSPYHTATTNAPPTILLYGDTDPLIPITQGQDMHAKLNELGVYNEFNLYSGGHGNWSPPDILDAYTKLILFVQNEF